MSAFQELTFAPNDRILILAPHPDDETIATGGVIQKAVAMGLPIRVVWLTYGDNAETAFIAYRKKAVVKGEEAQAMGLVRHDEGVAAAGVLGLQPEQLTFLGYPDFRTLVIWNEHWGDAEPCSSMFTQTSVVPYANAFRPGTPYRADEILADIKQVLREFKPTKLFVSHPGDHNPDHISLYLFTRVALWDLSDEGALPQEPELYPFLVHHPEWPLAGTSFSQAMEPPERLAKSVAWRVNHLTPEQVERKAAALQKHATQVRMSAAYLNSFMRANELFGDLQKAVLEQGNSEEILGKSRLNPQAIPAQLTNAERAKWVGVERRAIWQEDDCFVTAVDFSRPIGNGVAAAVYMFGYRPDRPFAEMPKLQVRLSEGTSAVFDQSRKLVKPPVELKRGSQGFQLRVPLKFLGDPRWLMGSVRTYIRKVPLDWIAWRIIEVQPRA
jgi:LmbE family N-acetylglucosaminyl deacetylase